MSWVSVSVSDFKGLSVSNGQVSVSFSVLDDEVLVLDSEAKTPSLVKDANINLLETAVNYWSFQVNPRILKSILYSPYR